MIFLMSAFSFGLVSLNSNDVSSLAHALSKSEASEA